LIRLSKKDKYHARTLKEVDHEGRVISTRIVYDLDAMLRDNFPELEEQDDQDKQKKKGDLLPFPK
jgi:hypothetical protein